jgi:prepilin-type N-terminal cleavage/methylation domain-containing protein
VRAASLSPERGFSLIEVLIAAGLLATALMAVAELFGIAARSNIAARNTTAASVLAAQKIEELRALSWGVDAAGLPTVDLTSDTAVSPERPAGGSGLATSPIAALQTNTPGWVDYVDRSGAKLAGGAQPPADAIFIRRWSVRPLAASPADTLVIQVLVTPNRQRGAADLGAVSRLPEEARLVTVRTRRVP